MSEVRFDGVVPAPPADVFDLLADARNWPSVMPGVETVDGVDGWGAPGGRCRLTIRLLGQSRTFDCEMTDVDRPQLFRYLAREEGQPTSSNACRFAEVAGGTRVEISAQRDARRGVAGLYDRSVVPWALKRMLDRQMTAVTTTLAQRRRPAPGSD
jgi:carbon monoxide dehydrogenase subunit G